MFSLITNFYNKKTKGPTLMELFTATRKVENVLDIFGVCTTGDRAHTSIRYSSSYHTRVNMGSSVFFTASGRNVNYDEKELT
jgi:hypothetical protein